MKSAPKRSLDQIMSEFSAERPPRRPSLKEGAPVSVWLPMEYKSRYDKLQEQSRRQFSEKLRELIIAAIEAGEAKTASA